MRRLVPPASRDWPLLAVTGRYSHWPLLAAFLMLSLRSSRRSRVSAAAHTVPASGPYRYCFSLRPQPRSRLVRAGELVDAIDVDSSRLTLHLRLLLPSDLPRTFPRRRLPLSHPPAAAHRQGLTDLIQPRRALSLPLALRCWVKLFRVTCRFHPPCPVPPAGQPRLEVSSPFPPQMAKQYLRLMVERPYGVPQSEPPPKIANSEQAVPQASCSIVWTC